MEHNSLLVDSPQHWEQRTSFRGNQQLLWLTSKLLIDQVADTGKDQPNMLPSLILPYALSILSCSAWVTAKPLIKSPLLFSTHSKRAYQPVVNELQEYINSLPAHIAGQTQLDEAVQNARKSEPMYNLLDLYGITDGESFYKFANDMLYWTPTEDFKSDDVYNIISVFHFVLDQDPLGALQTPIKPESAGQGLTQLSQWIVRFAQSVGCWLDTRESLTPHGYATFKASPKYRADEWFEPDPNDPTGGFLSFNEFFGRKYKSDVRPIAEPNNDTIVVFPADSLFDSSFPVDSDSIVSIKGVPWNIEDLLQGSKYKSEFKGGVFMHSFLSTYNYHRQHAPVGGRVVEARIIQGAAYLEVHPEEGTMSKKRNSEASYKEFPDAGDNVEKVEAVDGDGFQFLQMRGLFVIDNPVLGLVAVLPIGMAQVSSIATIVKEGDYVRKGDELSYFQFGGSDVVLVFQSRAGISANIIPPQPDPSRNYSLVNSFLTQAKL